MQKCEIVMFGHGRRGSGVTPQCEGDGAGKCLGVLVEGRSHGLTISEVSGKRASLWFFFHYAYGRLSAFLSPLSTRSINCSAPESLFCMSMTKSSENWIVSVHNITFDLPCMEPSFFLSCKQLR